MPSHFLLSPVRGAVRLRVSYKVGGAIAALCVGSFASSAFAQNECGVAVNGSVSCPVSSTSYPTGITYVAASDINVNAPAGVTVVTTAPATNGIIISSAGAGTLSGGATVTSMGDGSNGVVLTSGTGPASITVSNVTTAGALSAGIIASGGANQDVTVNSGNVATNGTAASEYFFEPSSIGVKATAAGTGNASVSTGTISTAAGGASGIMATADAGNVNVTSGAITTVSSGSNGVSAQSNSGNVAVTVTGDIANAAGQQTAASTSGVYASALNGAAAVTVQNVTMAGTYDDNGVVANAGAGGATISAHNVVIAGTFGNALAASSTGGDASIAANNITATGVANTAAYSTSDVGTASITTTGNVVVSGRGSFGLIAQSGTGNASITANNVSVVASSAADTLTTGNAILAEGDNATVIVTGTAATTGIAEYNAPAYSGDAVKAVATNGAANVTVQNARAAGAGSSAISATASGAANVAVNGMVTATNGSAVNINGGTASLTTASGSSVYGSFNGATISSLTGTTVNNGGTMGGAVFALSTTGGPATVNNSGTINGGISVIGGGDVVNNSGTFNAAGISSFAASDTFNNSGTVAIAAPGGVPVAVTFSGAATFNNSGTIDMRNGVAGDTLLLGGNYVGSGNAALGVDVVPGTGGAADRLTIVGTASGSTKVLVAQAPGAQAVFSNGTTVVQAGAASSATAFAVAPNAQNFGLVRYDVVYNPGTFAYSLVAGPSDSAYDMLNYQTAERNLWYKSADAVSAELQSKRDALWNLGGTAPSGRFWVSMAASYDNSHSSQNFGTLGQNHTTNTNYNQDYFGGQLGLDLSGGLFSRGGFAVGITGGYINSKVKLGGTSDNINFDAVNGGAYASFTSGNIFATALGKYDFYWARPESESASFNQHLHGHAYGGRGELGARFGGDSLFVEPLAQISYVRTSLNPFSVQGTSVNFTDRNGLRGKAGGRIGGNTSITPDTKLAFYAGASYVHDFYGRSEVTLANLGGDYTVFGQKTRDAGEAVLGVNLASAHGITGFIEGTYTRSFGNGDNGALTEEGAGGRAGIRVQF